ncbi:MAG: carbohydrate binding family 9 domain-containing protein, partial [Gemmatimonadetes bacterium]|nr:carbohydrate binding family 9 domain-containing protein [Gemmatimonadota bacterium]
MTRLTGPVSALCLAPLLLPVATAHAQDTVAFASRAAIAPGAARREIEAVRVRTTPPVIDGRLDDEAWTAASAATGFTQLEPRPGEPATQLSEARIAYDEDAIYVAARLPDTHPDSIVAQLSRRDDEVHSDWFYVAFDSYHDRRTAFVFAVNPRGVKLDAFLYNDTQDDESWDAVWDVATRIDSAGWTAEFRIPLSQLRFSAVGESAAPEYRWGVNFARRIARRNEFSFWAPVPPDASGLVSLFGELTGLRGLRPPRRLELLPYSVARLTREPGEAANLFYRENALFGSLGADLKYGITSDLTLTASLNPDFGQVEADPSQVNLTAYESFFPEKRPFFIEGADIFQFGIGLGDGDSGSEQLFYSRRVGRPPQHTPSAAGGFVDVPAATTIQGAAKLSGKTRAGWSVGVLSALTAAEEARLADSLGAARRQAAEPLSHYGVARLIKDFRQGQSALGAILTAANRRLDDQAFDFLPSAGYAAGVDG